VDDASAEDTENAESTEGYKEKNKGEAIPLSLLHAPYSSGLYSYSSLPLCALCVLCVLCAPSSLPAVGGNGGEGVGGAGDGGEGFGAANAGAEGAGAAERATRFAEKAANEHGQ